jgi:hypothetical protein
MNHDRCSLAQLIKRIDTRGLSTMNNHIPGEVIHMLYAVHRRHHHHIRRPIERFDRSLQGDWLLQRRPVLRVRRDGDKQRGCERERIAFRSHDATPFYGVMSKLACSHDVHASTGSRGRAPVVRYSNSIARRDRMTKKCSSKACHEGTSLLRVGLVSHSDRLLHKWRCYAAVFTPFAGS